VGGGLPSWGSSVAASGGYYTGRRRWVVWPATQDLWHAKTPATAPRLHPASHIAGLAKRSSAHEESGGAVSSTSWVEEVRGRLTTVRQPWAGAMTQRKRRCCRPDDRTRRATRQSIGRPLWRPGLGRQGLTMGR